MVSSIHYLKNADNDKIAYEIYRNHKQEMREVYLDLTKWINGDGDGN